MKRFIKWLYELWYPEPTSAWHVSSPLPRVYPRENPQIRHVCDYDKHYVSPLDEVLSAEKERIERREAYLAMCEALENMIHDINAYQYFGTEATGL